MMLVWMTNHGLGSTTYIILVNMLQMILLAVVTGKALTVQRQQLPVPTLVVNAMIMIRTRPKMMMATVMLVLMTQHGLASITLIILVNMLQIILLAVVTGKALMVQRHQLPVLVLVSFTKKEFQCD